MLGIQRHVELADRFANVSPLGVSRFRFDFLSGAEGEGQEPNPSGAGQEPNPEGSESGTETPPTGEPQTFTREYVEALRAENADWRTKYQTTKTELGEVKGKLTEHEKSQLDDLERAKVEAEEAAARSQELERTLNEERIRNAIIQEASSKNFHDPEDAIRLIESGEIKFDDDGRPNKQSVVAQVKKLADAKPHLLKTANAGDGDGGAHGKGVNEDSLVAQVSQELQSKGHVLIPQ